MRIHHLLAAQLLLAAPAAAAPAGQGPAPADAAPAVAATPETGDAVERAGFHEELVVVAERRAAAESATAAAFSILDGALLARLPATSAAQAVALLPGFQILFGSPFGGLPMEVARGFFGGGEAGYVQLRVDGVPLADAESGAADWAAVAAPAIERIEALRGTASPLYGDTAFGGVIELTTRRADAGPRLAAGLAGGSYGTREGDLRLTGGVAGRAAASLSLDLRESDGYRAHDGGERLGARLRLDNVSTDGVSEGGEPPGRRGTWTVLAGASRQRRDEPGPLTFDELAAGRRTSNPLFRFDREDEERLTASVGWRRLEPLALDARLWHDRRESDGIRTLLLAAGFGDRAARRIEVSTTGVSALAGDELALSGGDGLDWTAGVDLALEDLASRHRAVDEEGRRGAPLAAVDGERRRLGAFANLGWDASARLRLVAGARWDAIDDRFPGARRREAWSPRAGAVVRLSETRPWLVYAQWSRAFKAPTLDQLHDRRPLPDGAGGTFTLANPELVPQRARTVEAGLRGLGPGATWHVAAYRTSVDDEIDFDSATFRFVNIGASLHRGVELGGALWTGKRGRVEVGWEWNEVFAHDGENEGRQLKNVPEHTGRLLAVARLPVAIDLGATVRHLAGRHLDDAHRFPLGDATLVDLRLARAFGPVELRLDVLNVLDDDFLWVGFALPSFTGGEVPFAFPGHRRSVIVGLRWTGGGR